MSYKDLDTSSLLKKNLLLRCLHNIFLYESQIHFFCFQKAAQYPEGYSGCITLGMQERKMHVHLCVTLLERALEVC